jgi:ABC-type transporter Mla subunit MlaD
MAQSAPGGGSGPTDPARQMADIVAEFTERLGEVGKASLGLTGSADSMAAWRQMVAQPSIPVAQLRATLEKVRARREQIRSLVVQLQALEQQLTALETTLRPLVEWTTSWDRLRQAMVNPLAGKSGETSPEATS